MVRRNLHKNSLKNGDMESSQTSMILIQLKLYRLLVTNVFALSQVIARTSQSGRVIPYGNSCSY